MILHYIHEIPGYLLLFTLFLCVAAGWMLDSAMGSSGSGTFGNAILLSIGAIVGFVVAAFLGTDLHREYLRALSIAMGGAIWLFFIWCFIKSRLAF